MDGVAGGTSSARNVVAAPGVAYFTHRPEWAEDGAHTCDFVDFAELSGAHVVIVGGRQSAYEWAALIHEAGAEPSTSSTATSSRVSPQVSWAFVDEHIDRTLAEPDYWRPLPEARAHRDRPPLLGGRPAHARAWLEPRIAGVHRPRRRARSRRPPPAR